MGDAPVGPSAETVGKLHNYLGARFFPWNFLLEPVDRKALDHYLRVVSSSDLLSPCTLEGVQEALAAAAADFLATPGSRQARALHGAHAPAYPFAFSQVVVFASLAREQRNLSDLGDLPSVARLLGTSADDAREREKAVAAGLSRIRRRVLTGRELAGRPLIDAGGAPLGLVVDLLVEGGQVVEVQIEPGREFPLAGLRKIGDTVAFPAREVRLRNPFSNVPRCQKRL
ncbi:MAG: hypothetical protein QXO51_02250 [Halobacteria archaeon]